jgi:hypothetical protein
LLRGLTTNDSLGLRQAKAPPLATLARQAKSLNETNAIGAKGAA